MKKFPATYSGIPFVVLRHTKFNKSAKCCGLAIKQLLLAAGAGGESGKGAHSHQRLGIRAARYLLVY